LYVLLRNIKTLNANTFYNTMNLD